MKFAALGSGSSGNSTVISAGHTCILLDNGFTIKETVRRLDSIGLLPEDIKAIVVTHEHGDHLGGVGPFSRRYKTPVYMTHGTFGSGRDKKIDNLHLFHAHESFSIGDLELEPFPTPHDAAESCQFIFSYGGKRFATLTDLGSTTALMEARLSGLDGLLLECNYDAEMLRNGPYGEFLQARIRSDYGHLDNIQSAKFLKKIHSTDLKTILLGHLSEKNNCPNRVLETLTAYVPEAMGKAVILEQADASEWYSLA